MVRPYDANTIADFVIQDSSSRGTPVSNLKLQKILYFLQAKYLTEFNKKLFHNEIQKWKYGPVVPDVYFRFDHYGASNIEEVPKEIDFSEFFDFFSSQEETFLFESEDDKEEVADEDKQMIKDALTNLLPYDPFRLVHLTHEHKAWLNDSSKIANGEKDISYSDDEIRFDFITNPKFQIWSK